MGVRLEKHFPSLSSLWLQDGGAVGSLVTASGRLLGKRQFRPIPAWHPNTMIEFIADICLALITG